MPHWGYYSDGKRLKILYMRSAKGKKLHNQVNTWILVEQHKLSLNTKNQLQYIYTVGSKSIQPPWRFPLTPIVNKSYNIVCCVYNINISNHPKYDFFKV